MSVVPGCNKWYFTSCFQVSYFSASFLGVAVYIREKKLRVWARGRAKTPNWSVIWFLGQSLEGKPQQLKIEWRQKILEYNQPISKDKNNHLLKCVAGLLGFRSVKMKVPFFNRNKWLEAVDRSFSCPPNRKTPEFWSLTSSFFWVSSLFLVINNFNFIVFQFQKTHLEAITHNFTPCVFFSKTPTYRSGGHLAARMRSSRRRSLVDGTWPAADASDRAVGGFFTGKPWGFTGFFLPWNKGGLNHG